MVVVCLRLGSWCARLLGWRVRRVASWGSPRRLSCGGRAWERRAGTCRPPQRAAVEPHGASGYTQMPGHYARVVWRGTRPRAGIRRAVTGGGQALGTTLLATNRVRNHGDAVRAPRSLRRDASPPACCADPAPRYVGGVPPCSRLCGRPRLSCAAHPRVPPAGSDERVAHCRTTTSPQAHNAKLTRACLRTRQ